MSTASPAALAEVFDAEPPGVALPPRYNVAPTSDVYGVVGVADGGRRVEVFRWGLVPSWAADVSIGQRLINARAETLAEKPSFSRSFARRRLLIPMDGFYEWQAPAAPRGPKRPVFASRADGRPLAVAGLWATWRDPGASGESAWLHTCTIITTAANALMFPVHDRMPAVLDASTWEEWLDPSNHDTEALSTMLRPAPDSTLALRRVGTAVNRVANDDPSLIAAVGEQSSLEERM